jgi:ABC-type uncharacterized transport system permease subunit
LPVPDGAAVTSFAAAEPRTGIVAYGFSNGQALVVKHEYTLTYPDDVRYVSPVLEFPLGEAPVEVADDGARLTALAVQQGGTGIALAAVTADQRMLLARYSSRVSFMTGEVELTRVLHTLPSPSHEASWLVIDITMRNLLAAGPDGLVSYYDIGLVRGRADPDYIWQSSSASDEFESKFSLVPLTVGTSRPPSTPCCSPSRWPSGAIYTAYFMTPKLRGIVKPTIEIMEALPTVILGFLAGLWLAPFAEDNLPAVFS